MSTSPRKSGRSRPVAAGGRRIVAAAAAVPLVATLFATSSTQAVAAGSPVDATSASPDAHHVTLVTGDVVTLRTLSGGKQTADVERPAGANGIVHVQQRDGDLYVLPDEALPLIAAKEIDPQLFNITDQIEMGYDDASTDEVPMIATYPHSLGRAASPKAPHGSKLVRSLPSVSGAALEADKASTRAFWSSIAPAGATSLQGGIDKLWLDGRVKANLKDSVPQIGAPTAWAQGYDGAGVKVAVLDTGVDDTHPDLVGQIDAEQSFVPGQEVADRNGHGTHVASTIVGTGAASGGLNKGVAPGADLMVGKVLSNEGFGQDSWIIGGMEWAAGSGAKVISMSLGSSQPSDGTDPMAVAVDSLTDQYGALFVIAAGNAGPQSVASPGAAAEALTVGAVDKTDRLAGFSSTGPVFRTGAIKPDISAPGVGINAARSQLLPTGTGFYQSLNGTSMATPHVAGAAAIVAQRHPEWSGQRIKDTLMSTSKGLNYTPYQIGTGRVDVAAAVNRTVQATGSVFLGNYDWPHEATDVPTAKTVTFTNSGDAAVTLNLAIAGTGPFTVSAPTVTVPAGGTADVTVTGDPQGAATGSSNTAYLVGTDATTGAPTTRTSMALLKEAERYDLTIKLIGRDGKPAHGNVVLNQAGVMFGAGVLEVDGERTLRLPPNTYTVDTALDVPGERPDARGLAFMVSPQTVLTANTEVVLDARQVRLLDTQAPQRAENRQRKLEYMVGYASGASFRDSIQVPVMYDDLYMTPTTAPAQGSFTMNSRWRQGEPMMTVTGEGLPSLDPLVQAGSPVTAAQGNLQAVYAGNGAASDYEGLDATGKAVVVTRSSAVTSVARAQAAAAAGAKLLLVVNDGVGGLSEHVGASPIPVASVHRDAGAQLVELAKGGAFKLNVKQVPNAGYVYDLTRVYKGQVPDRSLAYKPTQDELARIDARYHAATDGDGSGLRYDVTFSPTSGLVERERYASTRTEWVTPDQVWTEFHKMGTFEDRGYLDTYAKGSRTVLDWFGAAVHPSFGEGYGVRNARRGDRMTLNVQAWTPSGEVIDHGGNSDFGTVPQSAKLYQGDTLIQQSSVSGALQNIAVPAGKLPYRLVHDASRPSDPWRLSTRTHTEWRFQSDTTPTNTFVAQPLPLLELNYHLGTDLRGNIKAGSTPRISIEAGPQAGGGGDIGAVTSVTLQVSYDDGATWTSTSMTKGSDGRWDGMLKLPKSTGFVSTRTTATTDAGWSINQELIRAYGLS